MDGCERFTGAHYLWLVWYFGYPASNLHNASDAPVYPNTFLADRPFEMACSGYLFVDVSHGTVRTALVLADRFALDRAVWLFLFDEFRSCYGKLLAASCLRDMSTLGIQVYRYVRVYDAVQRQQVKWFMFALFAGLSLVVVGNGILGGLVAPLNAPDSWYQLLNGTFTAFLFISLPLAIGIAILRYRLWDIDVIINRTLVYGSLTALLALLYFGLIFGLQFLFQGIFGK